MIRHVEKNGYLLEILDQLHLLVLVAEIEVVIGTKGPDHTLDDLLVELPGLFQSHGTDCYKELILIMIPQNLFSRLYTRICRFKSYDF